MFFFFFKCENYLKSLANGIDDIANNTVDQNQSLIWHEKRRKRVTSFLFGPAFKARTEKVLNGIVKEIVFEKLVHTAATAHGRRYENIALECYTRHCCSDCKKF